MRLAMAWASIKYVVVQSRCWLRILTAANGSVVPAATKPLVGRTAEAMALRQATERSLSTVVPPPL
jgi:hypothetical protein